MGEDEDDDRGPQRSLLMDPRLAGAGGMLLAAAALAWILTHGIHGDGGTGSGASPTSSRVGSTAPAATPR
ncbi:hypothetical protein ABUW04_30900 [Streptacidiphilus sp. N1-10]|uniref:Uncharacterized protein n=1 Tax=Streptacidiphilus jeojiensis TaxID=3229225 RepID=A0ABV6XWP8_9ACTN